MLPPAQTHQNYVTLSTFPGGFITLPEKSFVSPSDGDIKRTVPSLAFLISHPGFGDASTTTTQPIRLMFDLGLRSAATKYSDKQQIHLQNRLPYILGPSIASQLLKGGLSAASDIDIVILSHIHYDHHGDPGEFPNSTFIVGSGSCEILKSGLAGAGSHQHFQQDLLPSTRTLELPRTDIDEAIFRLQLRSGRMVENHWSAIGPFPHALDLLGDGSIFVIDSPGHLPGHINLLCRVDQESWVYLGGDSCHDTRLLTGEKAISSWEDQEGNVMCIHLDKGKAEDTLRKIARLSELEHSKVQIIMAHDWKWYERNKASCFPEMLQL